MKKLFTLLVGVLLAGSAYGQTRWTTIFNQDMENGFDDQAMEFFEVSESHNLNRGPVRVVEDPTNPANHCIKVIVRSDAEAQAEGEYQTETPWGGTAHLISWDTQFFIYFKEPIPAGKQIRFKADVMGEKEGSFQFQTHAYPQSYINYQLFPNDENGGNTLSYTTAWPEKQYVKMDVVSESSAANSDGLQFQCIALNMTHAPYEGNVVYLDNIKVEIRDVPDPGQVSWINFMRKGVFSEDPIDEVNYGSEEEPDMVKVSNFMIQVYDPERGANVLQKAPVVETGDPQFPNAVKVPTLNYYTETVQIKDLDAEGNEQYDEEGNVLMKDSVTYYWENGALIGDGKSAPARYSSQFFVSTLHKMKSNEPYKFVFWAKADKPASLATQAHTMPTKYKDYNTFGSESDFALTTEWQKFELGAPQGKTVPSGANGCQTITFDCYCLQEANNYYFVFEECSFGEANVTMADRTLGTPEDIGLKVNIDDDEVATPIDMAGMLAAFEEKDFSFLNNGKDGIKLLALTQPEDPEEEPTETFSGLLPWTDGGFIDGQGYYMEEENGINIRLDDESIDGSKINVMVWNNPDSGLKFDNGESITTKLAISQSGWYYIYNVTLSADGATGIKDIQLEQKTNAIYDLMGRKVSKMDKGIYIVNGKKYIVK